MRNTEDLYTKLIEAYSDKNLNRITGKLIEMYKSGNQGQLLELANKISKYVQINSDHPSRCFSGLVLLYHPDRGQYYRKILSRLRENDNAEGLEAFSHIHLMDDLEIKPVSSVDEDIGYNPVYEWEDSRSGFQYFSESEEDESQNFVPDNEFENSFYNIVKLRMYGNLDTEFPSHYLEDFEDVEFAESQISSLDGIEHCKHVTMLDLTGNNIIDISDLWNLDRLEEVYLADNQIGIIDAIGNLTKLRILDISGNEIDDIAALFELENLEFVNLSGNDIPESQLRILNEKEVVIIH